MNPGLRAGALELISSRSSLKHVTDLDESSAINRDALLIIEISPRLTKNLIRRVIYRITSHSTAFTKLNINSTLNILFDICIYHLFLIIIQI